MLPVGLGGDDESLPSAPQQYKHQRWNGNQSITAIRQDCPSSVGGEGCCCGVSTCLLLEAANQLWRWGQKSWNPVFNHATLIPDACFSSAFDETFTVLHGQLVPKIWSGHFEPWNASWDTCHHLIGWSNSSLELILKWTGNQWSQWRPSFHTAVHGSLCACKSFCS